MVAWIVPPHS